MLSSIMILSSKKTMALNGNWLVSKSVVMHMEFLIGIGGEFLCLGW